MAAQPRRRFHLVDGMILVAATAAGLAFVRATIDDRDPLMLGPWAAVVWLSESLRFALACTLPVLAAWTLALPLVRLRRPRPGLHRVARQPGFVACLAASMALLVCGLSIPPMLWGGSRLMMSQLSLVSYTPEAGFAVAGAWLALALGSHWRPEPSWIDRLGRGVGWLWISANLVNWFRLALL